MKRIMQYFILGLMCMFLLACNRSHIKGDGKIVSQNRALNAFSELNIIGNFVVTVNADQTTSNAEIKTDENIQPYITTETSGGVLTLVVKKGFRIEPTAPVQVVINNKGLNKVTLNGKNIITVTGLNGDVFTLNMKGSGAAVLKGTSKSTYFGIEGSALVNAASLNSEMVKIKIIGDGKLIVDATKKLEVYINGGGQVTYFGQPPIVNREIYGSGRLLQGD